MSGKFPSVIHRTGIYSGLRHVRRVQPHRLPIIRQWRRTQHDDTDPRIRTVPQKVNVAERDALSGEISYREVQTVQMTEPGELAKAPAPTGSLSIVFTDIVKSTAIWETDVSAMAEAMAMHDDIVRKITKNYDGYEVKQNGDGFMLAFQTAKSALQFCLDVQQELLNAEWPEDLLKLQPSKQSKDEDGHLLFRGLRLRMSAHWGTPVCKWNSIIKRMDYLGPMVNRAARFIEVTEAGQIVVSEDFLFELQGIEKGGAGTVTIAGRDINGDSSSQSKGPHLALADLEDLQSPKHQEILASQQFEIRLLGEHEFKGLSEPERLYFLVPKSLQGRLDVWPKHQHVSGSKGNLIPGTE